MKKVIITILLVLSVAIMPTVMAAKTTTKKATITVSKEPVKVYLFYASWCSHCHDLISWFSNKYASYADKFEIVAYQVDDDQANSQLMLEIGTAVGRPSEKAGSIPFVVVGEWFQNGFGKDGNTIIEKALAASTDKNYKDVVAETIAKNKLENNPKKFSDVVKQILGNNTNTNTNTTTQAEESNDDVLVIIVFVVIVLGFGGLFLYSRKND